MTLTTLTIGANDYQSYASLAEADAFLAVDPTRSAAWAALTDDQKRGNLVAATRRLDLLSFSGEKTDPAQTTQWPRTGATCRDTEIADDAIPPELQNATALLAGSITLSAATANAGTSGSNIKRAGAGSAAVEFFRPTEGVALQDATAFALIKCLIAGSSGLGAGLASGTDGLSIFGDPNGPGLDRGFA